jgi:hypothetical protein
VTGLVHTLLVFHPVAHHHAGVADDLPGGAT